MSLPRYPEYKDSGVVWLDEVPGHWSVAPLKRSFRIVGGSTPKSEQEAYWDGEFVWVTPSDLSKLSSISINDSQRKITAEGLASCGTSLVPSGSIVLSTRAPIGSLAIAETELCTNQGCKSLVPLADTQSRFYGYLLSISTGELNIRGKGTTFLELSGDELGAFNVGVPPSAEQQTIAAFLDRETGKIDALVAEQQRLVELLAEKRQAVISHAVTKGLNPNAPMKKSGIEWLGEVPKHWIIAPLGYLAATIQTGPFGSQLHSADYVEGETPVINPSNIQDGKLVADWSCTVTQEIVARLAQHKLKVGDIVFGRRGEMGRCAMVTENEIDWLCGTGGLNVRLSNRAMPEFVSIYLGTSYVRELLKLESVGSTMDNLNTQILSRVSVPLPPLDEQQAIVTFLDNEIAKFDTLTTEANRAISLLQERRSALISAAVTGKIDVRNT
ncbi:MAG: restriction endonuclease subunit S [Sulfurimicrobium sp.]|nr:restriction endonuclease subunit S [Sulfurimicrobium sp.]MDP1704989.1 restriction endonuclease subunit S [Sulfurimicrobium sp.]MDP2199303.1 restriction endonuclease subunit S [Sulfurimicrobium sp.]MDP3689019.1 restriction endonuclease subunit S [Sulfurimicrobium sp.]MDZ7655832.1 restriction endonuclease subunit S [Sulfurimicrobium sp.]